jgi:hypothetical protein
MSDTQLPRIPIAILCFFAGQPDFAAVIGDLTEEFHQRAQSSGFKAARHWFWRETFRTAWALTVGELRRTPIRTTLMALACFGAIGASTVLYTYLAQRNLVDIVYGLQGFRALVLLNIIPPLIVGWTGAHLLPNREWALALTFILTSVSLAVFGTLYYLSMVRLDLTWLMTVMMSVHVLRLGCFCLGCLCARGWSAASSSGQISGI